MQDQEHCCQRVLSRVPGYVPSLFNILTDNVYHLVSGTFVLVVFGTASIAQSVLSLRTKGNFLTINFG